MNICMFGASFLPTKGGMEYVIHHLSNALVEQGHTVTVIVARVSWEPFIESHKYRLVRYGIPVRGFGILGINHLCSVLAFIFFHVSKPFDVLHCHGSSYAGSRARSIKRLFRKMPLIITPHGEDIQRVPEINYGIRLVKKWDRIVKKNLQSADFITAISLSVEKELDFLDISLLRNVPNGVHTKIYSGDKTQYLRDRLGINNNTVIFLSVGRNHIKKGYAYGIEAISLLVKRKGIRNIHYIIVGRGVSDHEKLVRKLGMSGHISLIEEMTPQEVRQCYSSADVFFSPSIIEGLSLVSIEAISSGLPLVVTDVPGNIDIVRDTKAGLIAKTGDIEDMSQQLMKLLDMRIRQEYSERARIGSQLYDWSSIAQQYVHVYEESINHYNTIT